MTDHCVIDLAVHPPVFRCEACGAEQELPMPIPAHEAARLGKQWVKDHACCCEPSETWASHPSLTAEERNPTLR